MVFYLFDFFASQVTEERDLLVARSVLPRHARSIVVLCRTLTHGLPGHLDTSMHREMEEEKGMKKEQKKKEKQKEEDLKCHKDSTTSTQQLERPSCTEGTTTTLTCSNECLQVYLALETPLRTHCKELHVSGTFDLQTMASHTASRVVVVIARLNSLSELKDSVSSIARMVPKDLCAVIIVFTVLPEECAAGTTMSGISLLQQGVKHTFREHAGHATVILVPDHMAPDTDSKRKQERGNLHMSTDTHAQKEYTKYKVIEGEGRRKCETEPDDDMMTKPDVAIGSTDSKESLGHCHPSKLSDLANLVTCLIEQETGCFHGQVLVV